MHRLPKMSAKSPSPTGCVLDLWAAFETDTSPEVLESEFLALLAPV